MEKFTDYITRSAVNEAARSPLTDKKVLDLLYKNGQEVNSKDLTDVVYVGYSKASRTHLFVVVWDDETNDDVNDQGEKLSYALNLVWIYMSEAGKVIAELAPKPFKEGLHVDQTKILAKQDGARYLKKLG